MVENCTPGDWSVEGDKNGLFGIYARHSTTQLIAEVFDEDMSDELPAAANAHMLAASKRLYEALKWFIDDIDGTHTAMVDFDANVEAARHALAAARGEQS